MAKKSIRQDLILKGLDPNNVMIGADGLFIAKTEPASNTTEVKTSKNAFILLDEIVLEKEDIIEVIAEEVKEPKMPNTKRKPKSE
jgi:hypothetical protein